MDLNKFKQMNKAFDYLFDALVVTNLQGIITDWNAGSKRLYGYSKEEAIGQPVSILHVPEDSEHITSEVSNYCSTGSVVGFLIKRLLLVENREI